MRNVERLLKAYFKSGNVEQRKDALSCGIDVDAFSDFYIQ